jgi:hypothetical protein
VRCSGKPWVPRYVKTGSEFRITSEGWVERKARDGRWRPLTSHYFWDNNYGAQLVCENLGFGKGSTQKGKRNQYNRDSFDTETGYRRCSGSSKNILSCRRHGGPNQNDLSAQAYVKCWGKPWVPRWSKTGSEFRITVDGWVYRKARDNVWRPMTSHYFWDNNYGARIVCEDLGFAQGTTRKGQRNQNNRETFDTETGYRRCHGGNTSIL